MSFGDFLYAFGQAVVVVIAIVLVGAGLVSAWGAWRLRQYRRQQREQE